QQDVGYQLQPGSLLVLQIHYNLLATGAGETDQSSVRLRLTDGTAATKPLVTVPLYAPTELPCASGETGPLCDRAAAIADVTQRFGRNRCDGGRPDQRLRRRAPPAPGTTRHSASMAPTICSSSSMMESGCTPAARQRRNARSFSSSTAVLAASIVSTSSLNPSSDSWS